MSDQPRISYHMQQGDFYALINCAYRGTPQALTLKFPTTIQKSKQNHKAFDKGYFVLADENQQDINQIFMIDWIKDDVFELVQAQSTNVVDYSKNRSVVVNKGDWAYGRLFKIQCLDMENKLFRFKDTSQPSKVLFFKDILQMGTPMEIKSNPEIGSNSANNLPWDPTEQGQTNSSSGLSSSASISLSRNSTTLDAFRSSQYQTFQPNQPGFNNFCQDILEDKVNGLSEDIPVDYGIWQLRKVVSNHILNRSCCIQHLYSGIFIDVPGGSSDKRKQLIFYKYNGRFNQRWLIKLYNKNQYIIQSLKNQLCMTAKGLKEGENIVQDVFQNKNTQKWLLFYQGRGAWTVRCVDNPSFKMGRQEGGDHLVLSKDFERSLFRIAGHIPNKAEQ